jgi:hypothetical protein
VWKPILKRYEKLIEDRQGDLNLEMNRQVAIPAGEDSELSGSNAKVREVAEALYEPLHDFLKSRSPQANLVLPQMNAEAGFFDQLCVGLLFLSLVILGLNMGLNICGLGRLEPNRWWILIDAVAAVYCGLAAKYRYGALIKRHFAFWATL